MGYGSVNVPGNLPNKQDKLTGQPGQVVGFDGTGLAYAVPGWSNPNLLDNWYFADPVNQRGQTEYTVGGYTIDRWRIGGGTAALSDGQIVVRHSSGSLCVMQQLNKELYKELSGRTITISLLLPDGLLSATGVVPDGDDNLEHRVADGVGLGCEICLYKSGPRKDVAWQILVREQNSVSPIAAKLEQGAVQTLAHQDADGNWVLNDPPPNKALELAKCQRYFIRFSGNTKNFCSGIVTNATLILAHIPTPMTMRITPAATFSALGAIVKGHTSSDTSVDITNVQNVLVTINGVRLQFVTAGGLEAGDSCAILPKAMDGYLDLSADL